MWWEPIQWQNLSLTLSNHLVSITRIDEAGHDGRARQGNIFGHIRSSLGSKGVFVIVEYGFPEDDEQMNTDLLRLATVATLRRRSSY